MMEFNPISPDEAVCKFGRREVANPGAGNRMTAPADKKGPLRNKNSRLRAQRHDDAVCDPDGVIPHQDFLRFPKIVETGVRKIIHANSTTRPQTPQGLFAKLTD
jgi:hypothetical protein